LGKKLNLVIKCPKCGKRGKLRLKDKRYSSVVISHYNSKKYHRGKAGGSETHYIGSIKNTRKLIKKLILKYGAKFSEDELEEFRKVFEKFSRSIKIDDSQEIIDNKITIHEIIGITSILYELKNIKKILKEKPKIEEREIKWSSIKCPKCSEKIGPFSAKFRGVKIKDKILLRYPKFN